MEGVCHLALVPLTLLAGSVFPAIAAAQHAHGSPGSAGGLTIGAMAVGVYSRVAPGALNQPVSEAYLTQPMLAGTARAFGGHLEAHATLNGERWTLDRGEISPGVYGEGYVDRRHPHTWLHEAMLGVRGRAGSLRWALFGGKGFVPYGTDDPMVRPFVKYPVNHHHSQVLERAMVTIALAASGVALEAARFNGDEPESPSDWPNGDRALDSWAARATWSPSGVVEVSASVADVQSPEFAQGDGLDQRKHAASVRFSRGAGAWRYVLLEYARTREFSTGREAFRFSTALAEAEARVSALSVGARVERTTRPEEERTASFYRAIRPLLDFNILGRTRWTNVTVSAAHDGWGFGVLRGRPFVEVGYHAPRATTRPTPLDPVELFGASHVWAASFGVRLHAGTMRQRFGRYGLTDP